MPDCTGPSNWSKLPPWCFDSTAMALRKLSIACTKSSSSPLNSPAPFSRIARASLSASESSAIWPFMLAISASNLPRAALRLSTSDVSSRSLASAAATACVFSFSLVSHQHTILSYISASLACSAESSAFILPKRLVTRFTGLLYSTTFVSGFTGAANSRDQASSKERCLAPAEEKPALSSCCAPEAAQTRRKSGAKAVVMAMMLRGTGEAKTRSCENR
mmetsp:Transcript_118026/g.252095  ORF Transcript_118026/g.252095 Transcript_118026/m.252095 type:complete len:219 (-) Transcript_118026:51-707(-)